MKPEVKQTASNKEWWKCSRCDTKVGGNFCSKCRMAKGENEAWKLAFGRPVPREPAPQQPVSREPAPGQPVSREPAHQQPVPREPVPQQPVPRGPASGQPGPEGTAPRQPKEKKGNKGGVIAALAITAIILSIAVIVLFIRLITNNDGVDTRDGETYAEEHDHEDRVTRIDGPFNFNVWQDGEVVQVEVRNATLDVPLPPDAERGEVELEGPSLWLAQGDGEDWFRIGVLLRGEKRDDFNVYSAYEVNRALDWHRDYGTVNRYNVYQEDHATLLIIEWEDEFGEGITFTKISEHQGFILMTELAFETIANRDDFFETYGLNVNFRSIIRDYGD